MGGLQLHRLATTSEFFAIKRVEIRGTTHFSREEVLKAANLQSGVNSLTVNIADVEQGLRSNPWVLSVAVKRRLPDAFEIRIRERIPAFWMLKDGVLHYADNKGQIIAPVSVGNFLSLPTLEILPEDWDANLRQLSLVLSDLARRGELKTAREVWAADGNVWVVEPENV